MKDAFLFMFIFSTIAPVFFFPSRFRPHFYSSEEVLVHRKEIFLHHILLCSTYLPLTAPDGYLYSL